MFQASILAAIATMITSSAFASGTDPARLAHKLRNQAMAREFVDAHNTVRGIYKVPPLRWDRELAKKARTWARNRQDDCEMVHSETDSEYGENIFWCGLDTWPPARLVQSWADEVRDYNLETEECFPGKMCGHFTQVVWRDTNLIGCARVKCHNDKGWITVCNYKPPGNWPDESPFGGPKKS